MGSLEARYELEHHNPWINPDMSEQWAVNCFDDGCDGGWPGTIFDAAYEKFIPRESLEPYSGSEGECKDFSSGWKLVERSDSQFSVPKSFSTGGVSLDGNELKRVIFCKGPLTVCSEEWEHCVVLVGWDDDRREWIIKNSWGIGWGDGGYGTIGYDSDHADITNDIAYGNYVTYSGGWPLR